MLQLVHDPGRHRVAGILRLFAALFPGAVWVLPATVMTIGMFNALPAELTAAVWGILVLFYFSTAIGLILAWRYNWFLCQSTRRQWYLTVVIWIPNVIVGIWMFILVIRS